MIVLDTFKYDEIVYRLHVEVENNQEESAVLR
jgi:hypothetical protein